MNSKSADLVIKAKEYAFLLLKYRLRSEKELSARLKRKNFPEEIIRQTISFLKEKSFLDDDVFTRAWISSRLKRPFGLRRITQELKAKGIAQEIIARQVSRIDKDYSEPEVIRKLAQKRFAAVKSGEPFKVKRKVYAYLVRRGFSPDAVYDIISQL